MTLRLGYLLPENLMYYVGPVGVWGDVNDILLENMLTMKVQHKAAVPLFQAHISSWGVFQKIAFILADDVHMRVAVQESIETGEVQ